MAGEEQLFGDPETIMSGKLDLAEIAAPGAGATGFGRIYFNTADSRLYYVTDGGAVYGPLIDASGVPGGMTIGDPVTGGGANRVLYEDGSQNLAAVDLDSYKVVVTDTNGIPTTNTGLAFNNAGGPPTLVNSQSVSGGPSVEGQNTSTTDGSTGVYGRASGATGGTHGVFGTTDSSDNDAYSVTANEHSYLGDYADMPAPAGTGPAGTAPPATTARFSNDDASLYGERDASGPGQIPTEQYFQLNSGGSAITTIANFFGATSNPTLVANAYYEIEIWLFFAKTTAGTVTWTLTNSAAPTSQNIIYEESPVTGIVAPPGTATMLSGQTYNDATAAYTITTGVVNGATNNYAHIQIHLRNGSGTSLKIQATANAVGSLTPLIGSRWHCRRMPGSNTGAFAA